MRIDENADMSISIHFDPDFNLLPKLIKKYR